MSDMKYENGKAIKEYSVEEVNKMISDCQILIDRYQAQLDSAKSKKENYQSIRAQLGE